MTPFFDVRMRGFRDRAEVDAVLRLLDARTAPLPGEPVPLRDAAGRVLAAPVVAAVDVPGFARAAMDGFAVRAEDTFGADAYNPLPLALVGEALPAQPFAGTVGPGQAVRIMTGAPIPAGADAVLMAEVAREEPGGRVLAREPVSPGRHVGRVGEDVAKGREVLPAGRRLRPQDVGLLASIGVRTVAVVRRPRVAVLVTGDELLPPGAVPEGFRIVDSNSPMLAALVARDGGECRPVRYLPDHYEAVRDAIRDAPTRTWCWCPAGRRWGRKTTPRGRWPSWANWRSTAWPCGRRARRGSGSCDDLPPAPFRTAGRRRRSPSSSCSPATPSRACAPTTCSPGGWCGGSAGGRGSCRTAGRRCRSRRRSCRRSGGWTTCG